MVKNMKKNINLKEKKQINIIFLNAKKLMKIQMAANHHIKEIWIKEEKNILKKKNKNW